ncbi:hypothetical protein SLS56_001189 [Neofusicoccum ribis]|uniref:Cupin type-2 domain-containing protein n=1 Tax=Neofusicoccum ribis TaxID=45134 RepID=A0ABR3TAL3_9PEZI
MPLIHHFVPYHESAGETVSVNAQVRWASENRAPRAAAGPLLHVPADVPARRRGPVLRKLIDSPQRRKGPYVGDLTIGDSLSMLNKQVELPRRPATPYPHIHKYQTEYFRVESGILGITVEGEYRRYMPEDGGFTVNAGTIHQFRIDADSPEEMTVVLSASDAGMDYQLDRVYLENWHGYWHDVMLHEGGKMNLFQYLAIHDGGDVYMLPPRWVPFRKFIAY